MTLTVPMDETRPKLKPLARRFYLRTPELVARELLGNILVRGRGRHRLAGRIVETEAYLGLNDAAAHAAAGPTARNAVLFGPAGHAYVYFIYGMHYCFNVSCRPAGNAGCVLIRALEPISGIAAMARSRGVELGIAPTVAKLRRLASGPGRLAAALGITRARDNGKDVTASDLWIGDDGFKTAIVSTPRIGITRAVDPQLRFLLADNPYVSGKPFRAKPSPASRR